MAKTEAPHFRISSALKTIIGKELITNDIIAVFELVKNAFDAHATRVDIEFIDIYGEEPKLLIKDNGKGMDRNDILEKWLFVAYSAKKHGIEDYRDKIQSNRIKAGAKGIGRFSCDKLGSTLKLYSKKRERSEYQHINIDWESFEADDQREFRSVPVDYSRLRSIEHKLDSGTLLVIGNLREDWGRDKLLKLRRSLERLINPNQGNDSRRFSIHLKVAEERHKDQEVPEDAPWERVNGKITNFLFEDLEVRTTSIVVHISEDGKQITTRLEDRGVLIYELVESNPYSELLKNISVYLFVLSPSAKAYFTRRMGIPAVQFGSVFLFKNGFRIYPFGDEGEDSLGIDRRKQQGTARYIGSRELIGRIEINGENHEFKETSSRDGGLIKNRAFAALKEFFVAYCLRRLERFTVDVIKWGKTIDLNDLDISSEGEIKSKIFEIIASLAKSKDVLDIQYDPNFINIYENISESSVKGLLQNFERIAEESGSDELAREARRARRQLRKLQKARDEAEAEAASAQARAEEATEKAKAAEEEAAKAEAEARESRRQTKEAEEEADRRKTENLFLKSVISTDYEHVVSLHHHIAIAADTIQNNIKEINRRIKLNKPLTTEYVKAMLGKISYQATKIDSTARFATKANFVLSATEMTADLVGFIREYIENVCADIVFTRHGDPVEIICKTKNTISYDAAFRPIEITIIIDNLISNSRKAGATKIEFRMVDIQDGMLVLSVRDNGSGIDPKHAAKLFDFGFTTTNGSGLGLYHIKTLMLQSGGTVTFNEGYAKGAEFILCFAK